MASPARAALKRAPHQLRRSQLLRIPRFSRFSFPIRQYSDQADQDQTFNIHRVVFTGPSPRKAKGPNQTPRKEPVEELTEPIEERTEQGYSIPSRTFPREVVGAASVLIQDNTLKVRKTKSSTKNLDISIPNVWLRDNCRCSQCIHPDTRQRMIDTFSVAMDATIESAERTQDGTTIHWTDGHESHFPDEYILLATSTAVRRAMVRQGITPVRLWGSKIEETAEAAGVDANDVLEGDYPLKKLLYNIRTFGFTYVTIPDATLQSPESLLATTEKVLRRIAFIRETHYGGFYDFTADLASADTAYTNIALEAHTDNTYFSDPAGLQAFHLISHTDGEGGASLLVDGFRAALQLLKQDYHAYRTLSEVNVYSHASGNDGISIQPYRGFPVFEHDPATRHLLRVRWNSADRAGIAVSPEHSKRWYKAAAKFNDILKSQESEYWAQLTPGKILIFDNWRVLHGRSAFTGKRRICGAYINRDDWISRLKMLQFGQETVLDSLGL